MKKFLKQLIKKTFNQIGLDINRRSKSPANSLLGLKRLPINTIIDVGANNGQFSKYIKNFFPEARFYCFEPLSEPFKELKQWSDRQRNGRTTAFNFALGDTEGITEMFYHIEYNQSSSFLKTTKVCENLYPFTKKQKTISVEQTALDKWAKALSSPLEPEILIKLDVQGYEDRVIRGGRETFNIAKVSILEINIAHLYEHQAMFEDIFLLLYDLGYRYAGNLDQSYADDGHIIHIDAVFIK
ncbi:MAG: FkbM family methyltransferase [Candidatus Hodarchaeota archaeon]